MVKRGAKEGRVLAKRWGGRGEGGGGRVMRGGGRVSSLSSRPWSINFQDIN